MSTITKNITKTISLRLPMDLAKFLENDSKEEGRSVSNYIKWLVQSQKKLKTQPKIRKKIQDMNDEEFQEQLEKTRKIGRQAFADHGLDVDKMTEEDAYNFFKNI